MSAAKPTVEAIGEGIARWVEREFPSLGFEEVIAGCEHAVLALKAMRLAARPKGRRKGE
jgi:hypothetical protein